MATDAHVVVSADRAAELVHSWPGRRGPLSLLADAPADAPPPTATDEVREAMDVLVHPTRVTEVTALDGTDPTTFLVLASGEGTTTGALVGADDRLVVCRTAWIRDQVARLHPATADTPGEVPPLGAALPAEAAWVLAVLVDHQRQEALLAARAAGTTDVSVAPVPVEPPWITSTLTTLRDRYPSAVGVLAETPAWSTTWLLVTVWPATSLPTGDTDVHRALRVLTERELVRLLDDGRVVLAEPWSTAAEHLLLPERSVQLITRRAADDAITEDHLVGFVTPTGSIAWVTDPDAPRAARLHSGPAGYLDAAVRRATEELAMARDLLTIPNT